jgi:SpoVK/Ycf46/Vps4 family AAA+-type ATPase
MAYHNTTLGANNKVLNLEELHLSKENRDRINQFIEEFYFIDSLKKVNIPVDNKILLHGHTGCGKTATANTIGMVLNKNVITLNLGSFVSSKLGETAKNLSEVFRRASNENAILFIDEFDFIGKIRDYDDKDSSEMKRLVNALIQQIDNLSDNSILICATNHLSVIDTALLRRFQLKLAYELPTDEHLNTYYDSILAGFPENISKIKRSYGISYAEAKDLIYQQIKANVIQLEKLKKHLVFSYGRKQKGTADKLLGYNLETKDAANLNEEFPIAKKSTNKNELIEGVVFELTGEELMQMDKNEAANYKRVMETTALGIEVWMYVAKKSF